MSLAQLLAGGARRLRCLERSIGLCARNDARLGIREESRGTGPELAVGRLGFAVLALAPQAVGGLLLGAQGGHPQAPLLHLRELRARLVARIPGGPYSRSLLEGFARLLGGSQGQDVVLALVGASGRCKLAIRNLHQGLVLRLIRAHRHRLCALALGVGKRRGDGLRQALAELLIDEDGLRLDLR